MPEDTALTAPGDADAGQVVATPEGQGESTPTDTTGQAPSADAVDAADATFTSIDPATLPDELKETYNSMLRDYRTKTSELSGFRKDATSWQEKAQAFDALMGNDQFNRLLTALDEKGQDNPPTNSLTGEDLLTQILEDPNRLNEIIDERAKQLVEPIAHNVNQERAEKAYSELATKYPDLAEHEDTMAELIEESGYKMTPDQAYRLATYDKVKQSGINQGVEAARKRNAAAQPSGAASATPTEEYGSLRDAITAAFRTHRS